jgi:nicotinate dehydrogenase subunit B
MATNSLSLTTNPRLSQWIGLLDDGRFELRVGKVELGQGILTALKQIALRELCVGDEAVAMAAQSTEGVPNEGLTAGSLSVVLSGEAVQRACMQVRIMSLRAAAAMSGQPLSALRIDNGNILDATGRVVTTYAALRGSLDVDIDILGAEELAEGSAPITGGPTLQRLDLPDKVHGRPSFIQDMSLPGLLHARIVRPPMHDAQLKPESEDAIAKVSAPVTVFRDGSFLAVLANAEEDAYREAGKLSESVTWDYRTEPPPAAPDLANWLRAQPIETAVLKQAEPSTSAKGDARHFSRTYSRPYIAHASIAPSCALARWTDGRLDVWTHSQGIFLLRGALAAALGLSEMDIVVHHVQSAGCYGHNGADDTAFDAAFLAMKTDGRPVRVLWSRADEMGAAPVGPAMTADVSAWLHADGAVSDWSYEVWSNGFLGRPGYSGVPAFIGDSHRAGRSPLPPSADASAAGGYGIGRNAIPAYEFDGVKVLRHRLLTMPIRTSALRCLGAHLNVFAIESWMDEMAVEGGFDAVTFRLEKLQDARAKAVIRRAAELAGWGSTTTEEGIGRGIAYARYKNVSAYCAVVAEVEAAESLKVRRLLVVVDAGRVVNLDGLLNQVEGGALQAVSWSLQEEVRFDRSGITTLDWESYPILRFSEMPKVETSVIDRPDEQSLGVGECVHGPVAAALGNALYNALGVRVRHMPLNNENIMRAMDEPSQ